MKRSNKSIFKLFAERSLPINLLLQINKTPRTTHVGRKTMLTVLKEKDQITHTVDNIDVGSNIIMCSKQNSNMIRQNFDGTFNVFLRHDENLSIGKSAISGNMSVFSIYPQIKMSIPQGFRIDIIPPAFKSGFFDKIYSDCKVYYDKEHEVAKNSGFNELPTHLIMTDFILTFYIDVYRLRDINKTFLLKKGQALADIVFTELPHFQKNESYDTVNKLENIYLIHDDEIYDSFIDTF
jgi:hypothetical protein